MGKKLIILLGLITFIIPTIVSADVIMGKRVDYCFKITNVSQYPDYTILVYDEGVNPRSYSVINSDECTRPPYYGLEYTFYAIKNKNFNIKNIPEDLGDMGNYFKTNLNFIHSGIIINKISDVAKNDPREKIVEVLNITELNDNGFKINKEKVIYTYTDGTSEEKVYQNQDVRPEPSQKAILPWWFAEFWYLILPIIALLVIIAILIIRKLKK